MEIVGGLLGLLIGALIIGAIARFTLPGPDPLPLWATIAVGLAGSLLGGFLAGLVGVVPDDPSAPEASITYFFASVIGATVVLFLYRRFGQKRPITGPAAHRTPLRPRGLRRILTRQPHRYLEETKTAEGEPLDGLEKLVALRDAGKIDAAEFERRKAAFVEKL
ncbi:MAG TPA: GlsB/YeaQ/YmgE family stress response membrane protein [Gaiellaceae bacterium]|nr:GlsB/YeaQ/YmgE family stress response membrane protein [Gaiellaceae bacterium]